MVQILPEVPSFGQMLGRALGQGIGKGASNWADLYTEEQKDIKKSQRMQDILKNVEGNRVPPDLKNKFAEFSEGLQELQSTTGKKLSSEEIEPLWKQFIESGSPNSEQPQTENLWNQAEEYAKYGKDFEPIAKVKSERAKSLGKENLQREKAKEAAVDRSFAAHNDFIKDTTSSARAFETETKPRLKQMQNLNDEDLIGPTGAALFEKLGLPLGALENPSSELYQKLSQDLLKGLPETYGNRILKVEVENFLKTIPTLLNSPDGKRMIASNLLKLGEMKEVFYNEMRRKQLDAIDKNTKLPRDFEQSIFDNVKPEIDRINREFVELSNIKHMPQGTVPFFNPQGLVSFVPKDPEAMKWAEENGGKRIW